jgi:deoxyguanosine kinase
MTDSDPTTPHVVPERFRHIAVEGAIGVGKTTLARRLARAWRARLLLERPEENPFLEKFYADRARHALPTQLSFLFQRIEQARDIAQSGMFEPAVVSDFMFAKDDLFARMTLSDDEYRLYRRIATDWAPPLPQPDLVVWLRASPSTLFERVQRRGRVMEQGLDEAALGDIDERYATHFASQPMLPLIVVDAQRIDWARSNEALELLMQRVAEFRGPRESIDASFDD